MRELTTSVISFMWAQSLSIVQEAISFGLSTIRTTADRPPARATTTFVQAASPVDIASLLPEIVRNVSQDPRAASAIPSAPVKPAEAPNDLPGWGPMP